MFWYAPSRYIRYIMVPATSAKSSLNKKSMSLGSQGNVESLEILKPWAPALGSASQCHVFPVDSTVLRCFQFLSHFTLVFFSGPIIYPTLPCIRTPSLPHFLCQIVVFPYVLHSSILFSCTCLVLCSGPTPLLDTVAWLPWTASCYRRRLNLPLPRVWFPDSCLACSAIPNSASLPALICTVCCSKTSAWLRTTNLAWRSTPPHPLLIT